MASVGLAAIVRDEADNIERCLESVTGLVSTYRIVDTGSTDDTKKLIRAWAEMNKVDGRLLFADWENFKVNRSQLMAAAKGTADWILLLDADMVLHYDHGDLKEALDRIPDDIHVVMGRVGDGNLDYKLPFLVRGDKEWRYEGVAHSYLACEPPNYTETTLDGLWVEDHSHTTVAKLERDLEALSAEHARNPLDARTCFYLAQTYGDLDRFEEAMHYYRLRAHLDGWGEETYVARHRLGALLCEHVSFSEGARVLLDTWESRPSRAESLRALANVANNVADKIPYPDDLLFVHANAYANPKNAGISADKVSAVLVTRGNVDLEPTLAPIRAVFDDVVVWDNSKREDHKVYGRYKAAELARNDVIFSIDDDVIFTAFDQLLAAYEPGKIVANMDASWAAVYNRETALIGAGALWDKNLPGPVFEKYLAEHPAARGDFLNNCDFVFGSSVPFKIVDLGFEVREFSDGEDRLYRQPGQTERKFAAIRRAKALA